MRPECKHIDLIGKKTQKAATTVEVSCRVENKIMLTEYKVLKEGNICCSMQSCNTCTTKFLCEDNIDLMFFS